MGGFFIPRDEGKLLIKQEAQIKRLWLKIVAGQQLAPGEVKSGEKCWASISYLAWIVSSDSNVYD